MNPSPITRRQAGFSLIELLIAAAVGSLIVGALAESLGLFGEHVEQVRAEADGGPDEALALMADMARHGWSVEHPSDGELRVAGPDGALTRFELDEGTLSITRPSGVSGTLLEGVAALSVDTDSVRRLREAAPLQEYRSWWHHDLPAELLESLTLESGLPVGLGFRMDSAVPDEYDLVEDIDEHAESALLETLVIKLSYLAAIPPDPNEPIVGDPDEPSGPGNGNGNGNNKIEICHVPPNDPTSFHTLSVTEGALQQHLDHGDTLGPCGAAPDTSSAAMLVQLFEARAPDDARPHGPALGALSIPSTALPNGSAEWVLVEPGPHGDIHEHGSDLCDATTPDGKVIICHVPPGNQANSHAILVSQNAAPAHLAHGDYFGVCGDHGDSDDLWALVIDAPPLEVSLDLSPLNSLIEPGRAYSLVFELQGQGFVYMASAPLASSKHSGVAQAANPSGNLHALHASVPFELKGTQTITQTEEHHPISRVSLALEMDDGHAVQGSASVFGQVSVPGEWLGTVPGELAIEQGQGGDYP